MSSLAHVCAVRDPRPSVTKTILVIIIIIIYQLAHYVGGGAQRLDYTAAVAATVEQTNRNENIKIRISPTGRRRRHIGSPLTLFILLLRTHESIIRKVSRSSAHDDILRTKMK